MARRNLKKIKEALEYFQLEEEARFEEIKEIVNELRKEHDGNDDILKIINNHYDVLKKHSKVKDDEPVEEEPVEAAEAESSEGDIAEVEEEPEAEKVQTTDIIVSVSDEMGNPIQGARVILSNDEDDFVGNTGSAGGCTIKNVALGDYTVETRAEEYVNDTDIFTVDDGENLLYITIKTITLPGKKTKIYINGELLGTCNNPEEFTQEMREKRRAGLVSHEMNITYYEDNDEIYIFNDPGRARRPFEQSRKRKIEMG